MKGNKEFTDNFISVHEDSLRNKGWQVKSLDTTWWKKRNEKAGHLSLYTLYGDNWSVGNNEPVVRNLLMRKIPTECFSVEIHLTDFLPSRNWQQAGILISEDSSLMSRALRISISYNDFFGGYEKPPEIIVQVIGSTGSGIRSKPEEIAHISLFSIERGSESIVYSNLARSALRIEKRGDLFRFLYAIGSMEGFAFKEAVSGSFSFKPRFVSLFAIQGWAGTQNNIPVYFDSFSYTSISCKP
jgi:hypothetical protein